jgi:hypothetical protein
MTPVAERRSALIVATDRYDAPGLTQLAAPAADAEALAEVLGDPTLGGFDVEVLHNADSPTIAQHAERLLRDRKPPDLVLLHFSCHGLKDESGELFLAATNSDPRLLASTAVEAALVNRLVRRSRAGRVVLILDCCYGGAFERGAIPRAAGDVDVATQFAQGPLGGGRGRAIITASSAMEYAFEGSVLTGAVGAQPSVFTRALVEGIRTGAADHDQDGFVSLNELYEFVFERVRSSTPHQTPCKWEFDMQGELHIARNPNRRVKPAELPSDLETLISSSTTAARLGAVFELTHLASSDDLRLAAAAQNALVRLCGDDSRRVSDAAQAGATAGAMQFPSGPVDLGCATVGDPPLTLDLPVQGSPLAMTSQVTTSGSPLQAVLENGVLRLAARAERPGTLASRVSVTGPTGDAWLDTTATVLPRRSGATPPPEPIGPSGGGEEQKRAATPWAPRRLVAPAACLVVAVGLGVLLSPGEGGDEPEPEVLQKQVTVDGTAPFTDTGVDLAAGQRVTVSARGVVFYNATGSTGPVGFPNRPELLTPLPSENHNALIGRIEPGGAPFLVGESANFTASSSGRLLLGINDGGLENNRGDYTAVIVVPRQD